MDLLSEFCEGNSTRTTPLGTGSYGSVYGYKSYAIKDINPEYGAASAVIEIDTLKRLKNSPYIVDVYDYKIHKGKYYIIMELMDDNLYSFMTRVSLEDRVSNFYRLYVQILRGISAMNAVHTMHMDIKPQNILVKNVDGKYRFKLADFSLSVCPRFNLYDKDYFTPTYRPPEYIVKMRNFPTEVGDVWSFGMTLLEYIDIDGVPRESKPRALSGWIRRHTVPTISSFTEKSITACSTAHRVSCYSIDDLNIRSKIELMLTISPRHRPDAVCLLEQIQESVKHDELYAPHVDPSGLKRGYDVQDIVFLYDYCKDKVLLVCVLELYTRYYGTVEKPRPGAMAICIFLLYSLIQVDIPDYDLVLKWQSHVGHVGHINSQELIAHVQGEVGLIYNPITQLVIERVGIIGDVISMDKTEFNKPIHQWFAQD